MVIARQPPLTIQTCVLLAEPVSDEAPPTAELPQQPSGSPSAVTPTFESRFQRKKASLRQRAATLMIPPKKVGPSPTVWQSIRAIILASYLNVLLICLPISWTLYFVLRDEYTLVFGFSFLGIIPLAKLLAFATDDLSIRVGRALGILLNVTLGNTVELIVSIIALTKCELDIVQSALVGSILSNLLLVLGTCFFAGGLRFSEQGFGLTAAQMNSTLLTISVIAVLLPSAFMLTLQESSTYNSNITNQSILKMSHGASIVLIIVYVSYLVFQLFSHKDHYEDDGEGIVESREYSENPFRLEKFRRSTQVAAPRYTESPVASSPSSPSWPYVRFSDLEDSTVPATQLADPDSIMVPEEEPEEPRMNVRVAFGLLVIVTALVAVTAEFLVDSISGLTNTGRISQQFVGIVLLPAVGNTAEHVTEHVAAVKRSIKDKLTHSLGVAVDSSIQITLFVIPFVVTLGWILGKPLTLLFDPLQSIVMFLSVLTVNHITQDGKSNWLDGIVLICLYLILCVTFWYYPGANMLVTC